MPDRSSQRPPTPQRSAPASSSGPHPRDPQSFYDEMWRSYGHLDAVSPAAYHRRRLLLGLAAEREPQAILDVGCGRGALLRELARRFPAARLSGADVSTRSLAASARRCPQAELFELDLADPRFAHHHAERLGRFDLVVCSEVLEHLVDDREAAARLGALLAPGGRLLVTVPGGRPTRFDLAIGHQRHYSQRGLEQLLSGAGLRVDRVLAWGFPFHNVYRAAVRVASRVANVGKPASDGRGPGGLVGPRLGRAYVLLSTALRPLYYLNAPRFGDLMIALATKP